MQSQEKNRKGNLRSNWQKKMDLLTSKLVSLDQNIREVMLTLVKEDEKISIMAS